MSVYSVGHSNQTMERFIDLLKSHEIQVIVDVRSHPFSKYSVQFDHDVIKTALEKAEIRYLYLGRELGGMPKDDRFYDADGHVSYVKLSQSPLFQEGIQRLLNGSGKFRIALMCGEENPTSCHRRHLIAPELLKHGIEVRHIRGDGRIQTVADFEVVTDENAVQQLRIF